MKTICPFTIFCFLLSFYNTSLLAQSQSHKVEGTKVEVTQAKFIGKTPAVRDLLARETTSAERIQQAKDRIRVVPNFFGRGLPHLELSTALPQGNDPIWQKEAALTTGHSVIPSVNRDGIYTRVNPTDPNGDVGRDYYIQIVNASSYQVFDKQGNEVSQPINTNTLWSSLNLSGFGDPIIIYDQGANRWLLTEFTDFNPQGGGDLLLALSETTDPLGSWMVYNYKTQIFPDYPKYGLWNNCYSVTTNEFNRDSNGNRVLANYFINRQDMLNGNASLRIQRIEIPGINDGPGFFVGTPVDWSGQNAPPADAQPMILRLNDDAWGASPQDQIDIFSFDLDWDNPTNTSVNILSVAGAPFDTDPCRIFGPGFACIPQLGGAPGIDGSPAVIMNQSHYRNFGTYEAMVLNFITDANGNNLSGIRWMELRRTPSADWSIYQEGTYAPNDGMHRFMGSIAMDGRGNIGLAFSVSSASAYPGLRFTGRRYDDPLGEMTVVEYELAKGKSASPSIRWCDYTALAIDHFDERTFWFTSEYRSLDSTRTRIAAFKISSDDRNDLGATGLLSPQSSSDLSDMEDVQIQIRNFGSEPQTVYQVGYIFDNGTPVIEPVNLLVYPDSMYTHTFAPSVDLSQIKSYKFQLFSVLADDEATYNDTLTVFVLKKGRNDAGISGFVDLQGEFVCGDSIPTGIILHNYGTLNLTSATVEANLNGGTPFISNWTGDLAPDESDTIAVSLGVLTDGVNAVTAYSSLPNGMSDEIMANDQNTANFTALANGVEVTLTLKTDYYASEITWQLTNGSGEILHSGGPYLEVFSLHTDSWCLDADSCYTFTIFDVTGDGICCNSGQGFYTITDSFGDTLLTSSGKYGFGESQTFCATYACILTADVDIKPESVPGTTNDAVLIVTPRNGSSAFEYSLDGITYQSKNTFTGLSNGLYIVYVRDALGCVSEIEVSLWTVGFSDPIVSGPQFELFPNPTAGVFQINVKDLDREDVFLPIEIYSAAGQLVQVSSLARYNSTYTGQVSLVTQASGIYLVRFLDQGIDQLVRVVKE